MAEHLYRHVTLPLLLAVGFCLMLVDVVAPIGWLSMLLGNQSLMVYSAAWLELVFVAETDDFVKGFYPTLRL